ncbi:hypothetical protein BIFDEN_01147 [Bifidobacterium dentium ATCC 27678]|nr:hypothetical protein BIFDEN_01147 [Bifidobacterium dentium ATCC 27678]
MLADKELISIKNRLIHDIFPFMNQPVFVYLDHYSLEKKNKS